MMDLEKEILEYLQNNPSKQLDSVDIGHHFQLWVEVGRALLNLQEQGKIKRCYFGIRAWYEVT